jgi:hypothetical protein
MANYIASFKTVCYIYLASSMKKNSNKTQIGEMYNNIIDVLTW